MKYFEITSQISVYQRGKRFLVILSDVPYWMVIGKLGLVIVKYLRDGRRTKNEIKEYCHRKYEGMHQEKLDAYIESFLSKLEKDHVFDYEQVDSKANNKKYLIYTAGINITRNCNLRCLYCYAEADPIYDESRECLTEADVNKFLEGVKLYASPDCPVQFTGGEPLLRRELLYYGIRRARELGFEYITINTNGILLNQGDVDYFKRYNVDNVTISLDGTNENKHDAVRGANSFKKAVKAIKLLKENDFPVTASITIHKGNFDELEKFLLFCKENSVQPFTSPLFPIGRCACNHLESVDLFDIYTAIKNMYESGMLLDSDLDGTFLQTLILPLKDLVRRKYCGTGSSTMFMDSNGDLFPCTNTLGSDYFLCGNIRDLAFEKVWEESPVLHYLRNNVTVDGFEGCKNCDIRYICSGYCRGLTYQVTQKIDSKFIWCDSIKKCLFDSMWFLDEHPEIFRYFKDKFNRYNYADIEECVFL